MGWREGMASWRVALGNGGRQDEEQGAKERIDGEERPDDGRGRGWTGRGGERRDEMKRERRLEAEKKKKDLAVKTFGTSLRS